MQLSEALQQGAALQIRLPNQYQPLQVQARPIGEAFLVATDHGEAFAWLDPYWCGLLGRDICHIVYANPKPRAGGDRWVDSDPSYGPLCIAHLKPVVVERLDWTCPAWEEFERWQRWRLARGDECGREAAWRRIRSELADLHPQRMV